MSKSVFIKRGHVLILWAKTLSLQIPAFPTGLLLEMHRPITSWCRCVDTTSQWVTAPIVTCSLHANYSEGALRVETASRPSTGWHYLSCSYQLVIYRSQLHDFIYTYTLCPMCYGYIGSPKAGVYICSHEGAKRPREGWYILPLLVTQCFHSNEGRAVYGLYTRCLNILPRSITLRMFDHVHKLIDQQQPLVNWPFQCSTTDHG